MACACGVFNLHQILLVSAPLFSSGIRRSKGEAARRDSQAARKVPSHLAGPVGQPSGAPRQTLALHSLSWGACATTASPAL